MRRLQTQQNMLEAFTGNSTEELFAEKFVKVTFRDFSNNTRMDIKGVDLKAHKIKRDRAIQYWQNNVITNYLPLINTKKKLEVEARKVENETFNFKKMVSAKRVAENLEIELSTRPMETFGQQKFSVQHQKKIFITDDENEKLQYSEEIINQINIPL